MRVPHVGLVGSATSTLDLLDPTGFTFLTIEDGPLAAALRHQPVAGVRLRTVSRRQVDDFVAFHRVFGDPSTGLLVRPDGVVGWRTRGLPPDPAAAVARAFERCLSGG